MLSGHKISLTPFFACIVVSSDIYLSLVQPESRRLMIGWWIGCPGGRGA